MCTVKSACLGINIRMLCFFFMLQHDALTTFKTGDNSPALLTSPPPFPCNIHMKQTAIAPQLRLLGLGGSVPAYQNGEQIWDGFPYKTYTEMHADLHKLLDPVFFDDTSLLGPEDCVILMTHSGPAKSGKCVCVSSMALCICCMCTYTFCVFAYREFLKFIFHIHVVCDIFCNRYYVCP